MAKALHPPFSTAVVQVSDESVEKFTALGWTPVKAEQKPAKRSSRKTDDGDK